MTTKELYVPLVNRAPDNDLSFGVAQIVEADEQAKRDPLHVTDNQLEIIAAYDYGAAQVYARQRAEARARATAPPPVPAAPAGALRRSGLTRANIEMLARVIGKVLPEYVSKRLADAAPNAELEALLARLNGLIVLHEARITALETNKAARGLSRAGDHEAGRSYTAGEFCKRAGSVWLCTTDTASAPGLSTDWDIVIKGQARP